MVLNEASDKALQEKLAQLEAAYSAEKGRPAEVYARIVGYYRSVRNWNIGKKQEFGERQTFEVEGCNECAVQPVAPPPVAEPDLFSLETPASKAASSSAGISYVFFYREACPNCGPVKQYLADGPFSGKAFNADTPEGLEKAAEMRVFAAPTVVFFDALGAEIFRSGRKEELEAFFHKAAA